MEHIRYVKPATFPPLTLQHHSQEIYRKRKCSDCNESRTTLRSNNNTQTTTESAQFQKALILSLILGIFMSLIQTIHTTPVFVENRSLAQFTAQSGRNIRHLPCVVRKTGRSGTCMFAIECIKQNGTHLGTCIDRFYFGSCCEVKDENLFAPDISDNSIDQNTFSNTLHEATTLPTSALYKHSTEGPLKTKPSNNRNRTPTVQATRFTARPSSSSTNNSRRKPITQNSTQNPKRTSTRKSSSSIMSQQNSTTTIQTTRKPIRRRPTTTQAPILTTDEINSPLSTIEGAFETTMPPRLVTFQIVETTTPAMTEPTNFIDYTTLQPSTLRTKRPHRPTGPTTNVPVQKETYAPTTTMDTTTRKVRPSQPVRNTNKPKTTQATTLPTTKRTSTNRRKPTTKPSNNTQHKATITTTERVKRPVLVEQVDLTTLSFDTAPIITTTQRPKRPAIDGTTSKPTKTANETLSKKETTPTPKKPVGGAPATTVSLASESIAATMNDKSPDITPVKTTFAPAKKPKPTASIVKVPKPNLTTTTKIHKKPIKTRISTTTEVPTSTSVPETTEIQTIFETTTTAPKSTMRPSTSKRTTTSAPETTTSHKTSTTTKTTTMAATTTTPKSTTKATTKPKPSTTLATTTTTEATTTIPTIIKINTTIATTFKPSLVTWTNEDSEPEINEMVIEKWEPSQWLPVSTIAPEVYTTTNKIEVASPAFETTTAKPEKPVPIGSTEKIIVSIATSISEVQRNETAKPAQLTTTAPAPSTTERTTITLPTTTIPITTTPITTTPITTTPITTKATKPSTSSKPSTSAKPPTTTRPTTTQKPKTSPKPPTTAKPPATAKPTTTQKPAASSVSSTTPNPPEITSRKPSTSHKPSTSMKPSTTPKPSSSSKPTTISAKPTTTPPPTTTTSQPIASITTMTPAVAESTTVDSEESIETSTGWNWAIGTTPSTTSDSVTEDYNATTNPPTATTLPPNSLEGMDYRQICGRRMFPEPRIVGGSNAAFGRWPWQVSLRQWRTSTYLHKCGAALLNENWAITAAHCVDNVPPSDLLLRLGEYDLAEEEEPYGYQERRVQIVASHPQFDPRTFEYDLALLRFYEPVVFQPNIIPVCVPNSDEDFIGHTAFVTGWGRLYEDGPLPSVLQEVAVPVINNTICETMYRAAGYIEHIPHIFICAGWKKGGYDSCEGDSGGPMVIQRETDKRFQLGGVISWGIGCAEANQPGVYTRISEFRDWINQILQF